MSYYKVIKGSLSQTQRGQGEILMIHPWLPNAKDAIKEDMQAHKITLVNKPQMQADGSYIVRCLDNYGKRVYYIAMAIEGDIDDYV